ncbi:MAG: hypothetical protein JWO80_5510 [Bryobacterales bacterium]|nr:hypothetical protein [Bryobacterales bacterium]
MYSPEPSAPDLPDFDGEPLDGSGFESEDPEHGFYSDERFAQEDDLQ